MPENLASTQARRLKEHARFTDKRRGFGDADKERLQSNPKGVFFLTHQGCKPTCKAFLFIRQLKRDRVSDGKTVERKMVTPDPSSLAPRPASPEVDPDLDSDSPPSTGSLSSDAPAADKISKCMNLIQELVISKLQDLPHLQRDRMLSTPNQLVRFCYSTLRRRCIEMGLVSGKPRPGPQDSSALESSLRKPTGGRKRQQKDPKPGSDEPAKAPKLMLPEDHPSLSTERVDTPDTESDVDQERRLSDFRKNIAVQLGKHAKHCYHCDTPLPCGGDLEFRKRLVRQHQHARGTVLFIGSSLWSDLRCSHKCRKSWICSRCPTSRGDPGVCLGHTESGDGYPCPDCPETLHLDSCPKARPVETTITPPAESATPVLVSNCLRSPPFFLLEDTEYSEVEARAEDDADAEASPRSLNPELETTDHASPSASTLGLGDLKLLSGEDLDQRDEAPRPPTPNP